MKLDDIQAHPVKPDVAPHAGAWIETLPFLGYDVGYLMSHPTRVRGLKQLVKACSVSRALVAPHAGAWIETPAAVRLTGTDTSSHPTRVRGLKQQQP